MPRKPKISVENNLDDNAAHSANGKADGAEPKKKPRASAASPKKKKTATPKKASDKKKPPTATTKTPAEPTDEQIRLRAYFLAERRHRLALPGDSNHDWIEARRQLIEEARQP